MRNRKKNAVVLIFIIIVFTFFISESLGIETYEPERHMELRFYLLTTKKVAIILSCLQVLEYLVPILFFGIKVFLNKKKQNGKNTFKNICLYLFVAILLFLLIVGVGEFILKKTSEIREFNRMTQKQIEYNWKLICFPK